MFSEKNSMSVLIGAIYDGPPSAQGSASMGPDPGRIIDEDMGIHKVAELFLHTAFRRFVVVRDDRVVGQITRRNVLLAAQALVQTHAKGNKASGPSWAASVFMDTRAKTIDESLEIFSIATIFRQTAQRRLPVLRGKLLVGQITRKNLLSAANEVLNRPPAKRVEPLYLASVPDAKPPGMERRPAHNPHAHTGCSAQAGDTACR